MGVVVLVSVQSSLIPGQFPALGRTEEPGAQPSPAGALACGLCQADISLRLTVLKSPLSLVYVVHAGL